MCELSDFFHSFPGWLCWIDTPPLSCCWYLGPWKKRKLSFIKKNSLSWQLVISSSLHRIGIILVYYFEWCMTTLELNMRQVLLELARKRNKIPLPKSIAGPGIPLPPEQDTLINPNYQLAIPKKQPVQAVEETEDEESGDPIPSQEQKTDLLQHTPQRVSLPLGAKRPRWYRSFAAVVLKGIRFTTQ